MLVDAARAAIAAGAPDSARSIAVATSRRMLRPVINATGTILHTNLGRAPMAWEQPERYTSSSTSPPASAVRAWPPPAR